MLRRLCQNQHFNPPWTKSAPRIGERRPLDQTICNLSASQTRAAVKNWQVASQRHTFPQRLPSNSRLTCIAGKDKGRFNSSSLRPFDYFDRSYFSKRSFSDGSFGRRGNKDGRKNNRRFLNMRDCNTIDDAIEISFKELQRGNLSHRGAAAFWGKVPRLLGKISQRGNHTNEKLVNQLEKLIEHTRKSIKSFDQRCLSETILGLAKTAEQMAGNMNRRHNSPIDQVLQKFLPPGSLKRVDGIFNQLAAASVSTISNSSARFLSNQAYACTKIGFVPKFNDGSSFFDHIANESIIKLKDFQPQEISNLTWSFAKLKESNSTLFEKVGNVVVGFEDLEPFKPQELSNTVWAFATVGASHSGVFQKVGNEIVGKESLHEFTQQGLANIVWAFATVRASHIGLFRKIGNEIVGIESLYGFNPQHLANIVWSFATIGASHIGLYQKIGNEIVRRENLHDFTPQGLANTVWAFATIGESHPGLFQKVGDEIASLDNLHNYNPQALANIVWSYATARVAHQDLLKKVACEIVALNDLGSFNAQEISNIAWAFATAKQYYPELFDKIAIAAIQCRNELNPQEISNLLWAFSTVGLVDSDVFTSLEPSVAVLIDKFNCQELVNMAWSYSVSNVEAPCIFNKDGSFIEACLDAKDDFTVEQLSQLHQWQLWQRELGTGIQLPAGLQSRCNKAFTTQGFKTSKLQKDVISELVAIGLHPEEKVISGSGYCIDALIELHGEKVAVEIDGPSYYIGKNPTGSTVLKRRQVSALDGVRVVSVPYWEWYDLGRNREKRQQYLHSRLFH